MQKTTLFFVLAMIAVLFYTNSYSQQAFYYGPDHIAEPGDTVVLVMNKFSGNIQWQRSNDLSSWNDIAGETSEKLVVYADSTAWYRSEVVAGNCTFYSDTTYLSVINYSKDALNVDNKKLQLVSDSTEMEQGTFTYHGNDTSGLDIGTIVLGKKNQGQIRKITGREVTDSTITIRTEPASLEDAFESLEVTDSVNIFMSDQLKSAGAGGVPVPIKVDYLIPGARLKSTGAGGIDLSGVSFTVKVKSENGVYSNITATIDKGNLAFDPSLIRDFKISWFKLQKAKFAIQGLLKNDMDITVKADIGAEVEKEIDLFKASVGPVWMGVVPLFFEYSIKAVFTAGFNASGEMEFGFDTKIATTAGASYNRDNDPKWSTIWGNYAGFESTPPSFNAGLSTYAQMSMVPEFYISIAKMAGPYINVQPYLRSQLDVDILKWDFNVYGGINGNLGFKVEILGYGIADYYASFPVKKWNIYNKSGLFDTEPPVASNTSVGNVSTTYATVSGHASCPQEGVKITDWGVYYGTQPNPEDNGQKTSFGKGSGNFSGQISGLEFGTTYYAKVYATNNGGTDIAEQKSFTTLIPSYEKGNGVTDIDENHYETRIVGNQEWMAENLKVTHYNDESPIPYLNNYGEPLGAYMWYEDYEDWGEIYGALYNHYAVVDSRNLCPDGWHVPTDQEWKNLEMYLGMSQEKADENFVRSKQVADKLRGERVIPKAHPRWPEDWSGNNETGLSIYPAGEGDYYGSYNMMWLGEYAMFWTSTIDEADNTKAFDRTNFYYDIHRWNSSRHNVYSIRCIKD